MSDMQFNRGDLACSAGERKQLTILFCDLVDSTKLSTSLDPEDFRHILAEYQEACAGAVARYDGFVSDFRGDGIVIYFGFPVAREDDANRAAFCALDLVEAVQKLRFSFAGRQRVRVGISTGLVVVGEKLKTDKAEVTVATGEAPYLAARLQALAQPNEIVICRKTRERLNSRFNCRPQGPTGLKGFQEDQQVWVLGAPQAPLDMHETITEQSAFIVGRKRELALLVETWQRAKQGLGGTIALVGEAGIGKSHLLGAFLSGLANEVQPFEHLQFACSSIFQEVDYYPFAAQVARTIGVTSHDGSEARLAKLADYSSRWRDHDGEARTRTLSHLLGLAQEAMANVPQWEALCHDTMMGESLEAFVLDRSRSRPLVVVFEDLHWADLSTRDVVSKLVLSIANLPIMLVLTSRDRPDVPPENLTTVQLRELDAVEAQLLLSASNDAGALQPEDIDGILEKSDGIPLFIEEIGKFVAHWRRLLASASTKPEIGQTFSIPPNLYDLLSARLDTLGETKRVAQVASLLGRGVDRRLLAVILGWPADQLSPAIEMLVRERIFVHDPAETSRGESVLLFRHSLIQQAAYESMLVRERTSMHARVLGMLEAEEAQPGLTRLALLAYHAEHAKAFNRAIDFRYRLARAALSRSSLEDAAANVEHALELLEHVPDANRAKHECRLQLVRGNIAVAAKGYASSETQAAFRRAKALSEELGEWELLDRANLGLAMYHLDSGEVQLALDLATGILEETHARATLPFVHRVAATCNFLLGDLERSQRYLDRSLSLLETEPHDADWTLCGADLRTEISSWLAIVLSLRGKQEAAEALAGKTVAAARKLEHPYTLAYALGTAKVVYYYGNQMHLLEVTTNDLIDLAEAWKFPYFVETGRIYKGWSLVRAGRHDEGLAMMESSLRALRQSGENYLLIEFLVLLSDALLIAGRPRESVRAMADAAELRESSDVSVFDAEVLRMRARSGHAAGTLTNDDAAELFSLAIDTACAQRAQCIVRRAEADLEQLLSTASRA